MTTATHVRTAPIAIGALSDDDLDEADRICRVAFGTFLGVPQPETFFGDADYVHTRSRAGNTAALGARIDGELVGSNLVTNWGSVGFFGPLSVRVDLWDRQIASRLMESTVDVFSSWGTKHATLFTWSDSPKHHGLYQKFGFYPTFLTAIMAKPVEARRFDASTISAMKPGEGAEAIDACREVSDSVFPGLDLSGEIASVEAQRLGDTVVMRDDGGRIAGFAICHAGPGTEAGGGACFVKFGCVRSGPNADRDFSRLLDVCEAFASRQGSQRLVAGANMGRLRAYKTMIDLGFRTELTGVAMQQDGDHAYNRPDSYVIDDWR